MSASHRPIPRAAIARLWAAESERFAASNPRSRALADRARAHLPDGVPLHWMIDWQTPFPLFVAAAAGARLTDVDGHDYADFCLGDTGTMFGHVPPPVARAVERRLALGFSAMLPSDEFAAVSSAPGVRAVSPDMTGHLMDVDPVLGYNVGRDDGSLVSCASCALFCAAFA